MRKRDETLGRKEHRYTGFINHRRKKSEEFDQGDNPKIKSALKVIKQEILGIKNPLGRVL